MVLEMDRTWSDSDVLHRLVSTPRMWLIQRYGRLRLRLSFELCVSSLGVLHQTSYPYQFAKTISLDIKFVMIVGIEIPALPEF